MSRPFAPPPALALAPALACLFALSVVASARAETLTLDTALLEEAAALLERDSAVVSASGPAALALEAGQQVASSTPGGRPFGIGVQIGMPTALTLKYMLAANQGIVVGLGVGFGWNNGFAPGISIHADYLFHLAQLIRSDAAGLSLYMGPGLWLALFNGGYGFGPGFRYAGNYSLFGLGVRVPMGLSLVFGAAPLEIYLELDPALFVFPVVSFGIGASLGFRFYF